MHKKDKFSDNYQVNQTRSLFRIARQIHFENYFCSFVCFMVFSTTFNNISVISWRSVLLVDETGGPEENYLPAASH
jgi:hypothetical protein